MDLSLEQENVEEKRMEKEVAEEKETAAAMDDCRLQEGAGRRSANDAESELRVARRHDSP